MIFETLVFHQHRRVPNQSALRGNGGLYTGNLARRSAKYPLFIRFHGGRTGNDPVLDLLLPHCHRWQDVEFFIYGQSLDSMARIRGRLPSLRRLSIRINHTTDAYPGIFNAFEIAPQMHDVVIKRAVNLPHSLRLPWSQFTQYNRPIGTDIVEALRGLPNIVSCRLECHGGSR